jgi:multiple sugar transport system permease protein
VASVRSTTRVVVRHGLPVVAALVFLLPLWFMVTGSLRPAGQPPPLGLEVFPAAPTLAAYERLPELLPIVAALRNSLLVAALAVPLTVVVASLAGFGIRLLPPRARRWVVGASLLVLLVPVTAVWATRFELFRLVGAVDTFVPLLSPALFATSPLFVLLYAWSFGGISDSQLWAARLEGVGNLRLWVQVGLPQARPATLAVSILAFTFHWSNFIDPLLYLQRIDLYTLPLLMMFLRLLNPTDWPLLMAGCVIVTGPAVVVFLLAHRVLLSDDPLAAMRPSVGR